MSDDSEELLRRAKAEALRIHQEFEAQQHPPTGSWPQGEEDVVPPTVEMLIHRWALQHAPEHYAATYGEVLEPGVINVGFTADANRHAAALRAAFSTVEIQHFNARFTHRQLVRIQDEITELMSSGAVSDVYSCGVAEKRNVVHVGVADPASDEAQVLIAAYGDAVDVCPDEPIELL